MVNWENSLTNHPSDGFSTSNPAADSIAAGKDQFSVLQKWDQLVNGRFVKKKQGVKISEFRNAVDKLIS